MKASLSFEGMGLYNFLGPLWYTFCRLFLESAIFWRETLGRRLQNSFDGHIPRANSCQPFDTIGSSIKRFFHSPVRSSLSLLIGLLR